VSAVGSRGGRSDLAGEALSRVKAPTLLIVGGSDLPIIGMNEETLGRMHVEKRLEIVPGATHLFEEEGHSRRWRVTPPPGSGATCPPEGRACEYSGQCVAD
jgi:pimeloyl-ACP methyl ester carboxylesterase